MNNDLKIPWLARTKNQRHDPRSYSEVFVDNDSEELFINPPWFKRAWYDEFFGSDNKERWSFLTNVWTKTFLDEFCGKTQVETWGTIWNKMEYDWNWMLPFNNTNMPWFEVELELTLRNTIQQITFDAVPDAWSWYINIGTKTSWVIAFDDDNAAIQVILETLLGTWNVTVTWDYTTWFIIEFIGDLASVAEPLMTLTHTLKSWGVDVVETIAITQPTLPLCVVKFWFKWVWADYVYIEYDSDVSTQRQLKTGKSGVWEKIIAWIDPVKEKTKLRIYRVDSTHVEFFINDSSMWVSTFTTYIPTAQIWPRYSIETKENLVNSVKIDNITIDY